MRLANFINKFIFSIVFISIFLAFSVSIVFQYINFEKDKLHIKNEFIQDKKDELKKEIEIIFKLIDNKEETFRKLQDKIKETYDLEKIKENNQSNMLTWLASYKVGKNGYIFVNTLDKKALVYDGEKLKDAIPYPSEKLYNKILDTIKNTNGDFLFYEFKKPNSEKIFKKVAFVKVYEKYNWIIGTGSYLDEIEEEIARKEAIFKNSIEDQIKSLLIIFVLLLIGVYLITKNCQNT